jgi:hypothetical protein
MPKVNNICLVFEDVVQKVAEARLSVDALNALTDLDIAINPLTGEATAVVDCDVVPVSFEVACQPGRVFFRPTLFTGKIVNCGWAFGDVFIRNIETGIILASINIAATFQEEQEVPDVLPTDFIEEKVLQEEGSLTCLVFESHSCTGLVEPVLIVKCIFLVKKTVTRELAGIIPICIPINPTACVCINAHKKDHFPCAPHKRPPLKSTPPRRHFVER